MRHGSAGPDPNPHQNVTNPQYWSRARFVIVVMEFGTEFCLRRGWSEVRYVGFRADIE
jgi:hypothetical protein